MPSETESHPEQRLGRRDRRRGRDRPALVVGAVVVLGLLFLLVLVGVTITDQNDKLSAAVGRLDTQQDALEQQQAELASLRAEQSRASCLQQNATIAGQRAAFAASIEAAIPAGAADPRFADFKTRYLAAVNTNLRFRDCSTSGIKAYFDNPPAEVPCTPDGKGFCLTEPGG